MSGARHALLFLLCLAALVPARAQKISGESVLALTRQYLAVAPKRWIGSPGHDRAEAFIKQRFAPEAARGNLEVDSFSATTPAGLLPVHNIIVKFPGKKDGVIILASHYETNYPLRDTGFVGANDGAATTALLIALGDHFRAHPPLGYSVWLVFFDGEEAVQSWSDADSLYGSRHLAAKWSQNGTIAQIKALLLADMIGDRDLNIDRDENSTPALATMLAAAAKNTGHAGSIYKNQLAVQDDHLPFVRRGVPSLDIIDIDYGPHTAAAPDGWHHTDQDTLDKLSARSLGTSADLFLEMIRLLNEH